MLRPIDRPRSTGACALSGQSAATIKLASMTSTTRDPRVARLLPRTRCVLPLRDDVAMAGQDQGDRVVPVDELTAADLSALGWAFTKRHN